VAYKYIDATGVIIADTSANLAEVQNEFKIAFGADLDLTPSTPQGILITAETLTRDGVQSNNADLANQLNPNLAEGLFLDAVCALTGLQRTVATKTTVTATVTGVSGTILTVGAKAKTINEDEFEVITTTTIPISGTVDVLFQSVSYGNIPCLAGTLTQIVDGILGWETITNAANGVLGTYQQTDVALRLLRKNTLALQGISTPEAIISNLYKTEGVKSLQFRENVASTTEIIDGISMVSHSIYVCVDGGTDADVGMTLLENKSMGAGYNGTVTVAVAEPISGQTYNVTFDRPMEIPIKIRVTIKLINSTIDPQKDVKNIILAYANGEIDGEPGFTVGNSVSPYEVVAAVARLQGVYVQLCELTTVADNTFTQNTIPIAINEKATITSNYITVVVL
jgi:hypothetical protein